MSAGVGGGPEGANEALDKEDRAKLIRELRAQATWVASGPAAVMHRAADLLASITPSALRMCECGKLPHDNSCSWAWPDPRASAPQTSPPAKKALQEELSSTALARQIVGIVDYECDTNVRWREDITQATLPAGTRLYAHVPRSSGAFITVEDVWDTIKLLQAAPAEEELLASVYALREALAIKLPDEEVAYRMARANELIVRFETRDVRAPSSAA